MDTKPGSDAACPQADPGRPVAVEVRNVTKDYNGTLALKGVSLDIMKGEFFSLLGPSGCGKTTLLRIIGGFEEVTGGTVRIDGEDCTDYPPYRRKTNMIFQHLALFPHLDVGENVAFGLRRKSRPELEIVRRVREALTMVRLELFQSRSVDQLSGGQKQRVAIARALVNDPAVLLLDESLGALDLQLRLQMQDELRRLHRELGNTFIFVTHDQGEAMMMSDRVAVMNAGRIEQIGTTTDVYERPRTRFVAGFIGHTNMLAGRIAATFPQRRYLFDAGELRLRCISEHDFAVGDMQTMALRYENVVLADAKAPGAHRTTLVDRTFMGSAFRLHLRLDSGAVLIADTGKVAEAKALQPGASVWVTIPDDAAVIVMD